ncbi:OB-fold domain-containing protein [Natrinema sp. SYSU A 869]|uniref:OB-fold domain-containing protein n=1 Tax=Natrinema sp. SYSU A 869 TaxID=2871694 RepID=UPI001CA40B03|nr:OB-fold domain-containing protein [Natrinema sp. SYSU A 869]
MRRPLGQECLECGHATAAPKAAYARCGSRDLETVELPTTGTVYTVTTITVPPRQFSGEDSYQVAIVELNEARVMAHIDGEAEIGDEVRLRGTIEADDAPAPLFG